MHRSFGFDTTESVQVQATLQYTMQHHNTQGGSS